MTYPVDTKNIPLYTPIEGPDGQSIISLTMREPKVRDRLKFSYISGSEEQKELAMIADLCGQTVELLQELTIADYKQLEEQFLVFMVPPEHRESLVKKMKSRKKKSNEQ